jgi:hypothetical protein
VAKLVGDDVLDHVDVVAHQPGTDIDGSVGEAARGVSRGAAGAGHGLRGDVRAAASGRSPRHGEAEPQGIVILDGHIEPLAEEAVAVEHGGRIDADLRHAGADEIGRVDKLFASLAALEQFPGRLEGHVSVAPHVHGILDDHDVVGRKPGLDQVGDDLLVLDLGIGTAAGQHHATAHHEDCRSLEHVRFPRVLKRFFPRSRHGLVGADNRLF